MGVTPEVRDLGMDTKDNAPHLTRNDIYAILSLVAAFGVPIVLHVSFNFFTTYILVAILIVVVVVGFGIYLFQKWIVNNKTDLPVFSVVDKEIVIGPEDYHETGPFWLEKYEMLEMMIKSDGPVNWYLMSKSEYSHYRKNTDDFDYTDGTPDVTKESKSLMARRKGSHYLIIENEENDDVSVSLTLKQYL